LSVVVVRGTSFLTIWLLQGAVIYCARIAVSIVSVAITTIMPKALDMFKVAVSIAKYVPITTPTGVRVARKLTRTTTLVMKSQILACIAARIVVLIMPTGAIIVMCITEIVARIVRVVG